MPTIWHWCKLSLLLWKWRVGIWEITMKKPTAAHMLEPFLGHFGRCIFRANCI